MASQCKKERWGGGRNINADASAAIILVRVGASVPTSLLNCKLMTSVKITTKMSQGRSQHYLFVLYLQDTDRVLMPRARKHFPVP